MRLYIPAKWMSITDIEVAFEALHLFGKSLTPKHLKAIKLRIPIREDQLDEVKEYLPLPFQDVDFDILQLPLEHEFIFCPAMKEGLSRIRNLRHPIIGFQVETLSNTFRTGSVMLIDPSSGKPGKSFAQTLQMLYFDTGAQRALLRNMQKMVRKEESATFTNPFKTALNLGHT